eukprot:2815690-Rhodomonas_salina.1
MARKRTEDPDREGEKLRKKKEGKRRKATCRHAYYSDALEQRGSMRQHRDSHGSEAAAESPVGELRSLSQQRLQLHDPLVPHLRVMWRGGGGRCESGVVVASGCCAWLEARRGKLKEGRGGI